jgi:Protein of unknown function (DUF1552)
VKTPLAFDSKNPGLLLNRRRFLTLSASASILLAPVLRSRVAQAAEVFPKRVIFLLTGCGHYTPAWGAQGSESAFTLKEILSVLEKYKSKMIVTSGLDLVSCANQGAGHERERAILTNAPSTQIGDNSTAEGASIDQLIAAQVGTKTRLRSLEFAFSTYQNGFAYCSPCYSGPRQQMRLTEDMAEIFDRVFKGVDPKVDMNAAKRAALNQSILDNAKLDLSSIQKELTGEEHAKLDAHLSAIRAIEQSLQAGGTVPTQRCIIPTKPLGNQDSRKALDVFQIESNIIAAAMACDVTRVFTVQWGMEGSHSLGHWPEAKGSATDNDCNHNISHLAGYTYQDYIDLSKVKARGVLALCDALAAVPEGTGSALDNTVIMWSSANRDGGHTSDNLPTVLIGSCGGYFSTGRYLQYAGENHSRILLSMAEAAGANIPSIGHLDASKATSVLPRLKA